MTESLFAQMPQRTVSPSASSWRPMPLQRKCACGGSPGPEGECEACRKKRLGLQRQKKGERGHSDSSFSSLTIKESAASEAEADRIAAQVVASNGPTHKGRIRPPLAKRTLQRQRKPEDILPQSHVPTAPMMRPEGAEMVRGFSVTPATCGCETEMVKIEAYIAASTAAYKTCLGRKDVRDQDSLVKCKQAVSPIPPPIGIAADVVTSTIQTSEPLPENRCAGLISHAALLHESRHLEQFDQAARDLGATFFAQFKQLEGDPQRLEKLRPRFPAETKKYETMMLKDVSRAVQMEIDAYKVILDFFREIRVVWSRVCKTQVPAPELGPPQGTPGRRELQRSRSDNDLEPPGSVPAIVDQVIGSAGQALDPAARAFMENRLGYDFGRVRIHVDALANESARAVRANAYTVGEHIVFGAGRYSPDTGEGKKLLAHELTHVVNPAPLHQPGTGFESEAGRSTLQRHESGSAPPNEHRSVPTLVHEVLATTGQPLEAATRDFMESRFGYDFGNVRVHTDARATESARAVDADAYTVGAHVVFDSGRFSPATDREKRLLAHELVHVIQQRDSDRAPDEAAVHGATRAGNNSTTIYHRAPVTVARQPKSKADEELPGGQNKPGPAAAGGSPSVQMPACVEKGVDQFIPDPQKPNVQLWGLTPFSGAGGQQPELKVAPAPSGKGVVVQSTGASIPAIQMQFLKPGHYFDKLSTIAAQAGGALPPGSYPVVWNLTKGGSEKIKAGEQEHCNDIQLAFYFSLYRFAEIVNDLARDGTVFKDEAAARVALGKKAAIEPQKLPAYFQCLGDTMAKKRDDSHWHSPPPPKAERATVEFDATARKNVAVIEFTEKSLPEVGKHGTVDLLANHAAPACIGFTTLKPAKP